MGRFDNLNEGMKGFYESLAFPDDEPAPRTGDRELPRHVSRSGVDIHRPDERKMDDYWDLFETVSIVREPIRAFAVEVVGDGYTIEADTEENAKELEKWLDRCALLNGEPGRGFDQLLQDVIIQREVRGTALVEKVPTEENPDLLWGFKIIPSNTVKHYAHKGQSLLLSPTDTDVEGVVLTEDGEAAAYVQFDDNLSSWNDYDPIPMTRDQVIKLVRDADAGAIFGTSRLAAVEDRVESLEQKLADNDKAIESLAYKFWLFQMGVGDDGPWHPDDIEDFMKNHRASDFQAGMKQAVQGDIDIKTISGETADIEEFLDFDVNWIMSVMPMPKYALGGFEENVNQFVSRSQETRIENQIRAARRELQSEFTPAIREKAEEMGIDPDSVELTVGGDTPRLSTDFTRPPASAEESRDEPPAFNEEDSNEPEENALRYPENIWDVQGSTIEELAHARYAAAEDEHIALREETAEFLMDARDGLFDFIEDNYEAWMGRSGLVDRELTAYTTGKLSEFRTRNGARQHFEETVAETVDLMEASEVEVDAGTHMAARMEGRDFAKRYEQSVKEAINGFKAEARVQTQTALSQGEGVSAVIDRLLTQFDSNTVRDRADLIAHMELTNAIEVTRLRRYEQTNDIVGIEIANDCNGSTPLCRNLAGCDGSEPARIYFDSEVPLGEQLQSQVTEELLFQGFDPIPTAPPFHMGCTSTIRPILATQGEE